MNRIGKLIILFSILIVTAAIVLYLSLSENNSKESFNTNYTKLSYNADSEIKNSLKRLENGTDEDAKINGVKTVENVIAITFEGMVDQQTIKKLLALLDLYNVKSTFFLPGIKAAEDPDTVKVISDIGQAIGNYTLNADKHMERFSQKEMVENFCRTNVILGNISGKVPTLFKCNLTEYSDSLLKAANASGLKTAVDNNYFLNYQSFSSQENASDFVKGITKGSIISIKMDSILAQSEYDKGKKLEEKKPAIDPKPTLDKKDVTAIDKNEKLIEVVGFLLNALRKNNYKIVPLDDLASYEDDDFTKNFEVEKEMNKGNLANVLKRISTKSQSVAYSFRGIENEVTLEEILKFLKENNIKATFFVTGNEIINYHDCIKKILEAGHSIGNGGMTGTSLENMSFKEICFEIYKCDKLLKEKLQISTNLFMPVYGKFNNTIREAASSLNYVIVTYSRIPVLDNSESTIENAGKNKTGYTEGDIVFFSLDSSDVLQEVEWVTNQKINQIGKNIVPIATILENAYTPNKAVEQNIIVDNTLNVDTAPGNYQAKRILNAGKKADLVTKIYTSQPSVAYIFRGVSNKEALDSVLQVLDTLHAKATFFVTGKEITNYRANVDEIVNRGHEICNGGYDMNSNLGKLDFNAACYDIDMGERCLKAYLGNKYNDKENKYYMPFYADANEELLEAAKALGYNNIITYDISPISEKYRDLSADEIIKKYFANTITLQRGDIVYFRLDYLTEKDAISNLVYNTATEYIKKAPYDISTVDGMITSKLVYVPASRTQAKGSDLIKTTYNYLKEKLFSLITGKYIGNPSIRTSKGLIDFSDEDITKIDKTGKINTNGKKVIFLTFDDWGYDDYITRLLNVLKKYNVKATFFVRVGNENLSYDSPMPNPNLLRAMAVDGHDIGCHTFTHMKVDILTAEQQALLQKDIVTAHQEMARYIGDTGNLKLFFRPPTLAVSKLGLETVFNCGYKYIINGDFDPHDYEAESTQQLISRMINGISINGTDPDITQNTAPEDILKIGPGSIVVMHMLENARYTPEALDTVIPYYLAKGYQFAKLSEYLEY